MTVEDFIKMIAQAVAQQVASAPPKSFPVNRTSVTGQQTTQVSQLPQLMAELTDVIKVDLELRKHLILQMQQLNDHMKEMNGSLEGLALEMSENNELAKRHLKKLKRED